MRLAAASTAGLCALAIAACGSSGKSSSATSSTSSTSSTAKAQVASGSVRSTDGSFATQVPSGFTDRTSSAQGGSVNVLFLAVGPRIDNETININVIREQARGENDMDHIADLELGGIRKLISQAHGFSPVRRLTVGGSSGRSVDYLGSPGGHRLHLRQVFVLHQGWIYTITYTALPSTYQAHASSMDQVIGGWTWT